MVENKKFPENILSKMNCQEKLQILGTLELLNEISPDERLKAIIEVLENVGISEEALAKLTDTDKDIISIAKKNPEYLTFEEKYYFSSKVWMIYFMLKETFR